MIEANVFAKRSESGRKGDMVGYEVATTVACWPVSVHTELIAFLGDHPFHGFLPGRAADKVGRMTSVPNIALRTVYALHSGLAAVARLVVLTAASTVDPVARAELGRV